HLRDRVYAGCPPRLLALAGLRRRAAALPSGTTRLACPQHCHGGAAGRLHAAADLEPFLTTRQTPRPPARDRSTPPLPGAPGTAPTWRCGPPRRPRTSSAPAGSPALT